MPKFIIPSEAYMGVYSLKSLDTLASSTLPVTFVSTDFLCAVNYSPERERNGHAGLKYHSSGLPPLRKRISQFNH